jgi:RNA polymerase sigma-70 factor (ECF subfamily)
MNSSTHPGTHNPAPLAVLAEVPTVLAGGRVAPSPTDSELISRTRAGDTRAFADLIGRHGRSLLQLAQHYVHNDYDVQEVLQEVFVTTWTKLASFENRAQLSTWLYRVTVNAALMYLRGRRRYLQLTSIGLNASIIAATSADPALSYGQRERPDEQLESRELGRALEQALDSLPASLRTVFELREIQGRSTRQTAILLAISAGTVKSRLYRARRELQGKIKRCWLQ